MTREHTIRALNEAYIRSILSGDVAWFRDHLADEFICIESDALVRATGSWATLSGVRGISRYVDVYARLGDEWRVVSAQITRP